LTLYAFSVANWARPAVEVQALMALLIDFAKNEQAELRRNGIRVNVIGSTEDLPTPVRHAVRDLIEATRHGERMTLTLALSYGGRQDIVETARFLATHARAGLILPEEIDESFFQNQMTTQGLPDVDLLIRTGGETRTSDFLLFEAAHAEIVFLPLMWPDFQPKHLREAMRVYAQKERRFGLTSEQLRSGETLPSAGLAAHPFDPLDRVG
jgi:undecaprenyl diphosphate synthase